MQGRAMLREKANVSCIFLLNLAITELLFYSLECFFFFWNPFYSIIIEDQTISVGRSHGSSLWVGNGKSLFDCYLALGNFWRQICVLSTYILKGFWILAIFRIRKSGSLQDINGKIWSYMVNIVSLSSVDFDHSGGELSTSIEDGSCHIHGPHLY